MNRRRPPVFCLLQPPEDGTDDWRWWLPDSDSQEHSDVQWRSGSLTELADLTPSLPPLWLLLPAEHCAILGVHLPARRRQQIRRALPYAVEEHLIGAPEQHYFAYRILPDPVADEADEDSGPAAEGSEVALQTVAISRQRLDDWLQALAEAGLRIERTVVDALCLPVTPGGISALAEDSGRCLLRWDVDQATAVDTTQLSDWLALLAGSHDGAVTWYGEPPAHAGPAHTDSGELPATGRHQPLPANRLIALPRDQLLSDLQAQPDLVHDNPQLPGAADGGGPWRAVALAAVLALAALLVYQFSAWWQLDQRRSLLDQRISRAMDQYFPEIERVVRPDVQALAALEQASGQARAGDSRFLALLERATRALPADLSLTGLNFTSDSLSLELEAPRAAVFERYRASLQASGLNASLDSVSLEDERARARLRVTEQPS